MDGGESRKGIQINSVDSHCQAASSNTISVALRKGICLAHVPTGCLGVRRQAGAAAGPPTCLSLLLGHEVPPAGLEAQGERVQPHKS